MAVQVTTRATAMPEQSAWRIPALADVYAARRVIAPHLAPTPLLRPESLGATLGFDIHLKCENLQPVGAFKVRGGLNRLSQLDAGERERGVVAASTGNHGQSIAYAGRTFGVAATVFVPHGANPTKVAAMERMGAEVIHDGHDFAAACDAAEEYAAERGATFIHSSNEPLLIAGVATSTLEVMESLPAVDTLIVPVGGGSGLSGAAIVAKAISPGVRVIGVQAEGAPAVYDSWRRRELVAHDRMETFAEGLATRVASELTSRIIWDFVDDIVLVSDEAMRRAIATLVTRIGLVAEGAGAAGLAAAYQMRHELAGQTVAVTVSGGNLGPGLLAEILAGDAPW